MNFVLDASVIAKWFFPEEKTRQALYLRSLRVQRKIEIFVPVLILFEFGNIFVNKGVKDALTFKQNLANFFSYNISFIQPEEKLLNSTFSFTQEYNLTFYDASYLALAQQLNCDFITADKKLYQQTKRLKFVKLLGQIPDTGYLQT